jgi:hypothetical protein
MRVRLPRRGVCALMLLAAISTACTAPPKPAGDPLPGHLDLTSAPAVTTKDIQIRYVAGGDPSSISDDFKAGDVVQVGRSLMAGTYGIQINGTPCGGEFLMASELSTAVVLTIMDAGCGIAAAPPK